MKITHTINNFDDWEVEYLKTKINQCIESNQKVLPITINSYGGEVYSLLAMIDLLKASGLKIITIALGKAMSCGAILFSIGEERYITENASLMVHQVWSLTGGKTSDLESSVNEVKKLNSKIFNLLDSNTGNNIGFFENLIKENNNADLFLNSQQAIDYKLATKIGIPTLSDVFSSNELDSEENEDDIKEYDRKLCIKAHNVLYASLKNKIEEQKNIKNITMEGKKSMFKLTREQYQNDTKKFMDNKISIMDFRDDMFETEQAYNIYLDGKKDLLELKKSLDISNNTVVPQAEKLGTFDIKKFEKEMMEKANLMIETQNKRNELSNKVKELVKNSKITPAVADKHLETIKISNELYTIEAIINSLDNLPSNKSYSINEFIPNENSKITNSYQNLEITKKDIDDYLGVDPIIDININNIFDEKNKQTLDSLKIRKAMDKYGIDNKIDIYSSEKAYLDALTKVTNSNI